MLLPTCTHAAMDRVAPCVGDRLVVPGRGAARLVCVRSRDAGGIRFTHELYLYETAERVEESKTKVDAWWRASWNDDALRPLCRQYDDAEEAGFASNARAATTPVMPRDEGIVRRRPDIALTVRCHDASSDDEENHEVGNVGGHAMAPCRSPPPQREGGDAAEDDEGSGEEDAAAPSPPTASIRLAPHALAPEERRRRDKDRALSAMLEEAPAPDADELCQDDASGEVVEVQLLGNGVAVSAPPPRPPPRDHEATAMPKPPRRKRQRWV